MERCFGAYRPNTQREWPMRLQRIRPLACYCRPSGNTQRLFGGVPQVDPSLNVDRSPRLAGMELCKGSCRNRLT